MSPLHELEAARPRPPHPAASQPSAAPAQAGRADGNHTHLFTPEVLGGGVGRTGDVLLDPVRTSPDPGHVRP